MNSISKILCICTTPLLIAGCGGGTTSDETAADLLIDGADIDVPAVLADGTDDINAAATFPLFYTLNDTEGGTATIQTGIGVVNVIDATTIAIALEEGDDLVRLTDIGGGQYQGTLDGETITVDFLKGSGTVLSFLDAVPSDFGVTAIYGFETPEADLPMGSATYGSAGLARAYIAAEGDDEVLQVVQEVATNPSLTVDFASGNVTGELFDGIALVDVLDDGTADDTLRLQVSVANGRMIDGTLSGGVEIFATADVAGDGIRDLSPTTFSSDLDGRVFGASANVVGGTFEAVADFAIDVEEDDRINAVVGGTFFTVN